jgi:hypothetical protein
MITVAGLSNYIYILDIHHTNILNQTRHVKNISCKHVYRYKHVYKKNPVTNNIYYFQTYIYTYIYIYRPWLHKMTLISAILDHYCKPISICVNKHLKLITNPTIKNIYSNPVYSIWNPFHNFSFHIKLIRIRNPIFTKKTTNSNLFPYLVVHPTNRK